MRKRKWSVVVGAAAALVVAGVAAAAVMDFGLQTQNQLAENSQPLFGVASPVSSSSSTDLNTAQALADPTKLVTLAKGLKATVVAAGPDSNVGPNSDQMVLWPPSNPTYLIAINEEGSGAPALQKINLQTGKATTIATGIEDNDPVRATPWGTIIFGEETGDGAMYEIIDPLSVEGATIDRTTGVSSSPNIRRLDALGFNAYEGLAVLPNGVTYYGNELAASNGAAGGAYYKFVPTHPWTGGAPITSLDDSPYASGTVYALRVGSSSNYGQGFQYGTGSWRPLAGAAGNTLAPLAAAAKATGYYRPEDIDVDRKAIEAGNVRFCGNNTGRDSARYFGETICFTDGTVAASASGATKPEVTLFQQGSPEFNMPDNIAYQPGRGNWIVHEDGSTGAGFNNKNNDLWSCLDDGQDDNTMSDGCIRIGSLNDFDAEWTGGIFDASGTHFYVSVQHNSSGYGTILDITGWR
ncbi:MAG TPA: alkaline phosphatase PhoX [Thermoleophilaceae bacterium]|jgi:secreted PhoX family phosphatase|nr:alkaline phosphatase PhoX [Thermoleophilaceae bacterium]